MSTNQTETELKVVKLKANDGEMFEMAVEEALQSRTLKNMIDEKCDGVIPISNLTGPILSKVIDYCKKHAAAAAAAGDKEANDGLKDWDADFVKVDLNTLFDLIVAANYLDIAGLLDLTCQTVADMISGKTAEEVRENFNIENDFTPEEEEKIRKENQWAFM